MLEPPDLEEQDLLSTVEAEYGMAFSGASFLPVGADANAAAYRLSAPGKQDLFLKLKKGAFEETSVTVPLFLSKAGIHSVMAPLETRTGRPWTRLAEYVVLLYPFLEAQNGYEVPLTDRHRIELGRILQSIHGTRLPAALIAALTHEDYSPRWRQALGRFLHLVDTSTFVEPTARKMAGLITEKHGEIDQLIGRAGWLANRLKDEQLDFVLCHSDLHAGNLLVDRKGALWIVDWDNPILAPRERDLMFIGAGIDRLWLKPEEEALFYQGYGSTPPDADCLAYYRYERIVEDMVAYCEQILLTDRPSPDREQGFEYFASNFLPGNTIDRARQADSRLSGISALPLESRYNISMGFEEIPHTADWSVRVWAPDLPALLAESARAMNALAGVVTAPSPRLERVVDFSASDDEARLVALLSELLYYQELENLAFDEFGFQVSDSKMIVHMHGNPIVSLEKSIKAVTWHNLEIKNTPRGLEVEIVFDV